VANAAALIGVAFLGQEQVYIWILIGACAALTAAAPRRAAGGLR
jgi:hypothetical protein